MSCSKCGMHESHNQKYFEYDFDPEYVYILLWRYDFEFNDAMTTQLFLKSCFAYSFCESTYHKPENFNMRLNKDVISILLYPEKIEGESESEFAERKRFETLVQKIDKKIYEKNYFVIRDNNLLGETIEYNNVAITFDHNFNTFIDKMKLLINSDIELEKKFELLQMCFHHELTLDNFEETFNLLPGIGSEFIKAQKDFDKLK